MQRSRPQTATMFIVSINSSETSYFNNWRFNKFSGIKDRTNTFSYVSPFLKREFQIPTNRILSPVTLETPYIAAEHQNILSYWHAYQNQALIIVIEPTMACLTSGEEKTLGFAYELYGCIWIECNLPEVDREDNKISTLSMTFTATSAKKRGI